MYFTVCQKCTKYGGKVFDLETRPSSVKICPLLLNGLISLSSYFCLFSLLLGHKIAAVERIIGRRERVNLRFGMYESYCSSNVKMEFRAISIKHVV
jgi:hypothetical protein